MISFFCTEDYLFMKEIFVNYYKTKALLTRALML